MSFFDPSMEPMLDMFIFEVNTLLEQLDDIMLTAEKSRELSKENINEIFRIMHTIKGSSAMMGITSMSNLAHKIEDMFFIIRDNESLASGDLSSIFDIIFNSSDFFKNEINLVNNVDYSPTSSESFIEEISGMADLIKNGQFSSSSVVINNNIANTEKNEIIETLNTVPSNCISFKIFFEQGIGMENIRAFMLLNAVKEVTKEVSCIPENPDADSAFCEVIEKDGFIIILHDDFAKVDVIEVIETSLNVKSYEILNTIEVLQPASNDEVKTEVSKKAEGVQNKSSKEEYTKDKNKNNVQNMISVNQKKLDALMDIVGEIVIAESMVTSNIDLKGLRLDNFYKASRQLRKLNSELQDIVMSIRMVKISGIFNKMNRIVRDVSKKLNKKVVLKTQGEDTEIDKTINDIIGDPFMHMVRNAIDHAIEEPEQRVKLFKDEVGTILLCANNICGEVVITISDDGKGLDADAIYKKASEKGMALKPKEEYTQKEIFNLIMQPGFSTKEVVTEFSGRGVGMDVVRQNLEKIGGTIAVDSKLSKGTTFTIKIPLTLAIISGLTFSVGSSIFTIPITIIVEMFKLGNDKNLIKDSMGNNIIMVRGTCYPVLNLYEIYGIKDANTNVDDGIFILVETSGKSLCIFVDKLISENSVVVKPFPTYLNSFGVKEKGISGFTILGDGDMSIILDVNKFFDI